MVELLCFTCNKKQEIGSGVARRDECQNCGADMHVCKNCRFFDPGSYNECRESSAEVVRDKERSNFCDYFEPGSGEGKKTQKDGLLAAAEALFKKK